jgi:hypothetical protein
MRKKFSHIQLMAPVFSGNVLGKNQMGIDDKNKGIGLTPVLEDLAEL